MSAANSALDKLKIGGYEDMKLKKPKGIPRGMLKAYDDSVFEKFEDLELLTMLIKTLYKRHGKGLWMTIAFTEFALIAAFIADKIWRFFA